MKRPLLHLLTALSLLSLSACTSFNLTEQLTERRVPVVLPTPDEATYYELDGKYYCALTIAMAEEHIPLLSSKKKQINSFYQSSPSYTPDMSTAQTYLFQLSEVESEALLEYIKEIRSGYRYRSRPLKSKDKPGEIPPMIMAQDFDFARARRFTHAAYAERIWKSTRKEEYFDNSPYEIKRKDIAAPYPIAAIPAQEQPPGIGSKLLYGPVWVLDTAGNIAIFTAEAAATAAASVVVLPVLGILYLCGERLP